MLIGAIYRSELASSRALSRLGYGVEKTHPYGRLEIAGVSREVIDAFSTRRAEIEADSRRVKRAIRLVTVQDPGEATVF